MQGAAKRHLVDGREMPLMHEGADFINKVIYNRQKRIKVCLKYTIYEKASVRPRY